MQVFWAAVVEMSVDYSLLSVLLHEIAFLHYNIIGMFVVVSLALALGGVKEERREKPTVK